VFEVVPLRHVPAAFVFGPFDESDIAIGGDAIDAALDEVAVRLGPVRRDFGDGSGTMAFEPGGFKFGVASHDNFEGALAEFDFGDLVEGESEGFFGESVEMVDVPVEF